MHGEAFALLVPLCVSHALRRKRFSNGVHGGGRGRHFGGVRQLGVALPHDSSKKLVSQPLPEDSKEQKKTQTGNICPVRGHSSRDACQRSAHVFLPEIFLLPPEILKRPDAQRARDGLPGVSQCRLHGVRRIRNDVRNISRHPERP